MDGMRFDLDHTQHRILNARFYFLLEAVAFLLELQAYKRMEKIQVGLVGMRVRDGTIANEQLHPGHRIRIGAQRYLEKLDLYMVKY